MNQAWDNDVQRVVGARAVKNSLLGIITTRKGCRRFNPAFGCDLTDQLFETMTPVTADTIRTHIITAVRTFEPRRFHLYIDVQTIYDDNTVIVTVRFTIVDNPETLEQIKLQLGA